jgi:hypothetical protein
MDAYPRNVCENHKICAFCNDLALPDEIYCEHHSALIDGSTDNNEIKHVSNLTQIDESKCGEIAQCWGIAKKSKQRCKTKHNNWTSTKKYYCDNHMSQSVEDQEPNGEVDKALEDKIADIVTEKTSNLINDFRSNTRLQIVKNTNNEMFHLVRCQVKGCIHICYALNNDKAKDSWKCPFHELDLPLEEANDNNVNREDAAEPVVQILKESIQQIDVEIQTKSKAKSKLKSNEVKDDDNLQLVMEGSLTLTL